MCPTQRLPRPVTTEPLGVQPAPAPKGRDSGEMPTPEDQPFI